MILYIMIGCPGSGKSYFAKKHLWQGKQHNIYISRDEIRFSMLDENEAYFDKEEEVFDEFVRRIKHNLNVGTDVIIADATNLHWPSRRKLLRALGLMNHNYSNLSIIPVVMNTELEIALNRNNLREGRERVPEDILRRMYNSMTSPWKDPFDYTAVMEVRA